MDMACAQQADTQWRLWLFLSLSIFQPGAVTVQYWLGSFTEQDHNFPHLAVSPDCQIYCQVDEPNWQWVNNTTSNFNNTESIYLRLYVEAICVIFQASDEVCIVWTVCFYSYFLAVLWYPLVWSITRNIDRGRKPCKTFWHLNSYCIAHDITLSLCTMYELRAAINPN